MSTEQEDAQLTQGDGPEPSEGEDELSEEMATRDQGAADSGDAAGEEACPEETSAGGPTADSSSVVLPDDYLEVKSKAEERDQFLNELRRAKADLDNLQKRTRRERPQLEKNGARRVLSDLLGVVDNFERALASFGPEGTRTSEPEAGTSGSGEGTSGLEEGVRLIHQQLEQLLQNQGVREIAALGETFNPEYHEAVTQERVEDRPTGEIVEVLQRGYLHYDAVLRPTAVKVALNVGDEEANSGDDTSEAPAESSSEAES